MESQVDVGTNEGSVDDDRERVGYDDGSNEGWNDNEGSDEGLSLDVGIVDTDDV